VLFWCRTNSDHLDFEVWEWPECMLGPPSGAASDVLVVIDSVEQLMHQQKTGQMFVLSVTLLLSCFGASPAYAANCVNNHCAYLPFVNVAPPVRLGSTVLVGYCARGQVCERQLTGEVLSNASYPVYNVTLDIRYYSLTGTLSLTQSVKTALPTIFPGQPIPFTNFITSNGSDLGIFDRLASATVSISGWSLTSTDQIRPLTIISFTQVSGDEFVNVQITNGNPVTLTNVQSAFWYLGANDAGIDVKSLGTLAPNQTLTYSQFVFIQQGNPNTPRGKVAVQGVVSP